MPVRPGTLDQAPHTILSSFRQLRSADVKVVDVREAETSAFAPPSDDLSEEGWPV